MREDDKRPVPGTNNVDVVPGIDVHGASLRRYGNPPLTAAAVERIV